MYTNILGPVTDNSKSALLRAQKEINAFASANEIALSLIFFSRKALTSSTQTLVWENGEFQDTLDIELGSQEQFVRIIEMCDAKTAPQSIEFRFSLHGRNRSLDLTSKLIHIGVKLCEKGYVLSAGSSISVKGDETSDTKYFVSVTINNAGEIVICGERSHSYTVGREYKPNTRNGW